VKHEVDEEWGDSRARRLVLLLSNGNSHVSPTVYFVNQIMLYSLLVLYSLQ